MTLSRKVAVVTGGTGALGGAIVKALLGAGARVSIPCRRPDEIPRLRARLGLDADTAVSGAAVD